MWRRRPPGGRAPGLAAAAGCRSCPLAPSTIGSTMASSSAAGVGTASCAGSGLCGATTYCPSATACHCWAQGRRADRRQPAGRPPSRGRTAAARRPPSLTSSPRKELRVRILLVLEPGFGSSRGSNAPRSSRSLTMPFAQSRESPRVTPAARQPGWGRFEHQLGRTTAGSCSAWSEGQRGEELRVG